MLDTAFKLFVLHCKNNIYALFTNRICCGKIHTIVLLHLVNVLCKAHIIFTHKGDDFYLTHKNETMKGIPTKYPRYFLLFPIRLIIFSFLLYYIEDGAVVESVKYKQRKLALIYKVMIHQLRTWDHYPRAKYFQRYLQNVYPRFRNVTGFLPAKSSETQILDEISNDVTTFEVPPQLVVTGNEPFPIEKMVVRCTQEMLSQKQVEGSSPIVVVCAVPEEPLIERVKQALTATLQEAEKMSSTNINHLYVVYYAAPEHTSTEPGELKKIIHERCKHLKAGHLIEYYEQENKTSEGASSTMPSDEHRSLGRAIGKALENNMINTFVKMYKYLDDLHCEIAKPIKPTHREQIFPLEGPKNTCHTGLERKLIQHLSNLREEKVVLLDTIYNCIRCNIVPWIAMQLHVDQQSCAGMLDKMKFEPKIKHLLNLREYFKSIPPKENIESVVDGVLTDIHPFLDSVTAAIYRSTSAVKKMKYELQNCIELSNDQLLPERKRHTTDSLLNGISRIKGVYGFGDVFGELEFHIEEALYENTLGDIRSLLKEHNYSAPYKVSFVTQRPKAFADTLHDNGQLIYAQFSDTNRKEGTLGAFFESSDNPDDLFAITCGHVVFDKDNDIVARQVLINEENNTVVLGTPARDLILDNDIFDIAAIKVSDDIKSRCLKNLKNDEGISCSAHILEKSSPSIASMGLPYVYAYGGKSGRTYGTISSSNFQIRVNQDMFSDCLLLIEPQPDIENFEMIPLPFADIGDSGAVVCCTQPGSDDILVLSILKSGDYKNVGDPVPKCISILMHRGLQALESESNMKFVLCNT